MKKSDFFKLLAKQYQKANKYIDRELSWIDFNKRVLKQALRKEVPLMERMNFLAITNSNLDDFLMVRLAYVMNNRGAKKIGIASLDPEEAYRSLLTAVDDFKELQEVTFSILKNTIESSGVKIKTFKELSKDEVRTVSNIFYTKIYPMITPIAYDTTNEYPEVLSKGHAIAVLLEDQEIQVVSFISLDNNLDKIFKISDKEVYITLEEIIYGFFDKIYYKKKILDYGMIKLIREADIEISNDRDIPITDRMRDTLLQRRFSTPIYMDASGNISKSFLKLLGKIFGLKKSHVHRYDSVFNYSSYLGILKDNPKCWYKPFSPQFPPELIGDVDMFSAISNGDILLHHPYESYDPVIDFLEQASKDKNVLAIKQTLYRVSSYDSRIVEALCTAARNGKDVYVILEIKARFDEERNISLIEKLKGCGVRLIYGVERLKTHCKFISVVRSENGKVCIYTHVGTGNYNEKTAKLYTDISYFTKNFKVGQDAITVFNMISGFSEPTTRINKLYFSPYNLRQEILRGIKTELKNAKKGKKAFITFKMNSLCDKEIIDSLYEASKQGVVVRIFCRGICSMMPINKNIIIHSIVGRFLEHSRIYYFYGDGAENVYISSADLLTRNLDKRFELLIPIKDDETKVKLLKILAMYYRDTFNSYIMTRGHNGMYTHDTGDNQTNIHELFMKEAVENYKLKSIPKLTKR